MNPNTRTNPAAAALGVSGPATSRWDIDSLIDRTIARYNEQEKHAALAKEAGQLVTARLHYAVAYENARFLAGYYQHHGLNDLYGMWSRREMRAHLRAFNPPNQVAESISGGRAVDNLVSEDDEDEGDEREEPEIEEDDDHPGE